MELKDMVLGDLVLLESGEGNKKVFFVYKIGFFNKFFFILFFFLVNDFF